MRWPGSGSGDLVLGATGPLPFQRFRLSRQEQEAHATVWGRSGSGKSKLLQQWFMQRLASGQGAGILEPHHDLSFDTVAALASQGFFNHPSAFDRLIYIDWGNSRYVPFNVLANADHPQQTALNVLEAMLRAWPELQNAPLFQTLFLASMMVLLRHRLPITWLYALLTDTDLRARLVAPVEDDLVQSVFSTYENTRDQTTAAGSTLRRAFLFTFSLPLRHTLGQTENWLDFRAIMDAGLSVIINLGNVADHETRKLLGCLLTVMFEQAALSRADIVNPAQRRPFTLLIDEWSEFAAQETTIARVLSQARKYKLFLVLASQTLAQISSDRLRGAIENCRINVAFGLGRGSAELQAKQLGEVDPFKVKHEPATDLQHPQYVPLPEQWELWTTELHNLEPRWAYIQAHGRHPVKVKTLPVPASVPDERHLDAVFRIYAQRYQRSLTEVIAQAEYPPVAAGPEPHRPSDRPAYRNVWRKPTGTAGKGGD